MILYNKIYQKLNMNISKLCCGVNIINLLKFYFLLFLTLSNNNVYSETLLESWANKDTLENFQTARIISKQPMQEYLKQDSRKVEFDGNVSLVTLEDGTKGVFKSLNDDPESAYAEVAAYRASVYLGFPYVPPTVIRDVKGEKGSLQLFVPTSYDLLEEGKYEEILPQIDAAETAQLRLFYFIFGQFDSGPHNMLVYEKEGKKHLIAIDNTGIANRQFVKYGELPYVKILYSDKLLTDNESENFPFDNAYIIEKPTTEKLKSVFGDKLPSHFYNNFKSYGLPFKYIIWQGGLWKQFHFNNPTFVNAYVEDCPKIILDKLAKLDIKALQEIFYFEDKPEFITSKYLNEILARRDQVLNFFNNKKKLD